MYKKFYRFEEEPFAISPDPNFLYLTRSHEEALHSMISGIQERKGIIVITGEVGVGKTILIHSVLKDLSEKIKTAFIFQPMLDFLDLLKIILLDLEVPVREKTENMASLMLQFRNYLNERLSQDETIAIIIDEAQSMNGNVLEDLFRLSNLDTPATKLLQILLVGQPELEVKLNSEKLRRFKKRIAIHLRISLLTLEESKGYMRHRLQLVGRKISDIFTSGAVNRIWEFAEGTPRIMNLICDQALLIGYADSKTIIDSKIVNEAIQSLDHPQPHKVSILSPFICR
jgi:general secretion pathway protein A